MLSTPDHKSTYTNNVYAPATRRVPPKPKVYIAGPMRGIPHNNFPLFYAAQAVLELWGYEVVNPARMDMDAGKAEWNWGENGVVMDNGFTMHEALSRDFAAILGCKAVFVLPGWTISQGALRETWMAFSTGRSVFRYDPAKPINIELDGDKAVKQEEHPYENRCP